MLDPVCEGLDVLLIGGAAVSWPAFKLWQGAAGLERLDKLAGQQVVQVLCSHTTDYHGSLKNRNTSTCTFGEFIETACATSTVLAQDNLYLAQAPMSGDTAALAVLQQDIAVPDYLQRRSIEQVNLWMCTRGSRSSLHYDPYQNLLCVVRGCKSVHLFPPSTAPLLYPEAVWGESANHSCVDFAKPDLVQHPLYAQALEHQQRIIVKAGDALFIPAGWWHQIDSDDVTIAVNFWWQPQGSAALQGGHAAFMLRESLRSLTQAHVTTLLAAVRPLPGFHAAARAAADPVSEQRDSQITAEHNSGAAHDSPRHAAVSHGSSGCMHASTGPPLKANHTCVSAATAESHAQGSELPSSKKQRLPVSGVGDVLRQDESALRVLLAPPQSAAESEQLHRLLTLGTARSQAHAPEQQTPTAHQRPSQRHESQPGLKQRHSLTGQALTVPFAAFVMVRIAQQAVAPDAGDPMGQWALLTRLLASLTAAEARAALQALMSIERALCAGLLQSCLHPAGAELLTQHFEDEEPGSGVDGDGQAAKADFFVKFYGLFATPEVLFNKLIAGKEAFAKHAYHEVLQTQLGGL